MSFAKPILVSNATAQKRLVEKYQTGLIHKDRNVEDFTDKLFNLYHNDLLRKELGENGKNFVTNQFVWENTSKELIKLYQNIN